MASKVSREPDWKFDRRPKDIIGITADTAEKVQPIFEEGLGSRNFASAPVDEAKNDGPYQKGHRANPPITLTEGR